jgi:hypothetical protein
MASPKMWIIVDDKAWIRSKIMNCDFEKLTIARGLSLMSFWLHMIALLQGDCTSLKQKELPNLG